MEMSWITILTFSYTLSHDSLPLCDSSCQSVLRARTLCCIAGCTELVAYALQQIATECLAHLSAHWPSYTRTLQGACLTE